MISRENGVKNLLALFRQNTTIDQDLPNAETGKTSIFECVHSVDFRFFCDQMGALRDAPLRTMLLVVCFMFGIIFCFHTTFLHAKIASQPFKFCLLHCTV